jgi:outer membrane protein TolC
MKTLSLILCAATVALATGRAESPTARAWSLQECIQQALEHNLELRIERYNPELALYNLKGAYGAYDPVFRVSGQHDHAEAGETLLQGSVTVPGRRTDTDTFNSSLGGMLPWGMQYGVSLRNLYDTDGRRYDTNRNAIPYSTSGGSVSVDIVQPLVKDLWLNPTRLNISVYKNRLKWTEHGLRLRIMNLITRVEVAYYDLMAGYENVKVQQSALELAQRLLQENKRRVEVGALAPLDEKQSEAQAAARQADLIAAQRNVAVLENALKQLLTDDFAAWGQRGLELSGTLDAEVQLFNLQDSWTKGLTQRPDFLQASLDLERQGIVVKINRNELYPQVDLLVGGGYAGSSPEFSGVLGDIERRDQPFYYFGGQLTYPLGNRGARNSYRASKAEHDVRQLALKKLEQDIMVEIDNAIKLAQANYERVGATRKAREYAEAALAAEQKKLESGKSTSFFVLQLQRDLTAARSDEIQALVQYKRSLTLLAQSEGSALERNGIDLDVK